MTGSDHRERIYDLYASTWDDAGATAGTDAAQRWGRAYDYYLRGWLPESNQASVLDVGCGGGRLLQFFKDRGYVSLRGLDISEEQVQRARRLIPDVARQDVSEYLEGHPGAFELIAGLDIVEHLHKAEVLRFLDACHGALRTGGRLILQTPNAESPWGMMHRYHDFSHELAFTPNSLFRLLRLCGFSEVVAREQGPVPWGYSLASSARFVAWRSIRTLLLLWNLVETGSAGSGVLTRVFLISGVKG